MIEQYGNPSDEISSSEAFYARSYQEDCALMGGLRHKADSRLEFKLENRVKVVYLKNNIVIKEF